MKDTKNPIVDTAGAKSSSKTDKLDKVRGTSKPFPRKVGGKKY